MQGSGLALYSLNAVAGSYYGRGGILVAAARPGDEVTTGTIHSSV